MVEAMLAYLRRETESEALDQANLAAILGTLCDSATGLGSLAAYTGPDHAAMWLRPLAIKRPRQSHRQRGEIWRRRSHFPQGVERGRHCADRG